MKKQKMIIQILSFLSVATFDQRSMVAQEQLWCFHFSLSK